MKLYHGTRASLLHKILDKGLVPRGVRASTWEHAPSHPLMVYLTDAYAPYFAVCSVGDKEGEKLGLVIEVDSDRIVQRKLLPDEDALEQTNRGRDRIVGDMYERNAYYRSVMTRYCMGEWEQSLKAMGTCAYFGKIPPTAITRVAIIPTLYLFMWDALPGVANYRWLGPKYRAQTARLFGDPVVDPPLGAMSEWQVPLSGHDVYGVTDGMLTEPKHVECLDERPTWNELKSKLSQRRKEST